MATHPSVLAWRIPGTGEPGGLPPMGSHRVGHDWSDLAAAAAYPPNSRIHIPQSSSTLLDAVLFLSPNAVYYFIHKDKDIGYLTYSLSFVKYKLALAIGTCHLPLQRVKYELLQLLTSNIRWKEFSVCVCVCTCLQSLSHVWLFATPWIVAFCPWNFTGRNTGEDCHFLFQEIFWLRNWTCISCISCKKA